MKKIALLLVFLLVSCASSTSRQVDSIIYTHSTDSKIKAKNKIDATVYRKGTSKEGLYLVVNPGDVKYKGTVYLSSLSVWPEQINEFLKILNSTLNETIETKGVRFVANLGENKSFIYTQVINSELYLTIDSDAGILNFGRDDVVDLIRILNGIKSENEKNM